MPMSTTSRTTPTPNTRRTRLCRITVEMTDDTPQQPSRMMVQFEVSEVVAKQSPERIRNAFETVFIALHEHLFEGRAPWEVIDQVN